MRNKLQLILIFIGLLLCIGGISANAQGIGDRNRPEGRGNYMIIGKVYMPDGMPAKGVRVVASSAENSEESTRTNNDGEYALSGLSRGNYSLTVREDGYQAVAEIVIIAEATGPGQSFHATFNLKPSSDNRVSNPSFAGVPKDALAKYEKGLVKVSSDPKSAIGFFDEAIAVYPNFAAAYFEKGAAMLKINDIDKAVENFVKAIQIKPDYVEAKYSYGYAQYLKKNYEVAAAVFDDVLKQRNTMPEAHMYLGISLYYLKNLDAAEAQLKLATATESGERVALAHRFLGGIYMQKKRNGAAAVELQKYVELVPKAPDADKIKATIADLKKQG